MLNSVALEKYLRLNLAGFIPKAAADIQVLEIKKLSGGVTNELYAFDLSISEPEGQKSFELVLKGYPNDSLCLHAIRPGEDIRRSIREFDTLRSLDAVDFPVPKAYICEQDPIFLGYPFVIMQKEKCLDEKLPNVDVFANTLARLHNLEVEKLHIRSLVKPENDLAFAKEQPIRLKESLNKSKHYKKLEEKFNYAIKYLEANAAKNRCSQYSLLHGEYHPGHTIITNNGTLKVIDWESVDIGDPAFDVGYAYNMINLMYCPRTSKSGKSTADEFISEYANNYRESFNKRIEFYRLVGILSIAIDVSAWLSNPLTAYKRFGRKALARSIAYPFSFFHMVPEKWLNEDFLVHCLQYFQDFIKTL